MLKHEVVSYTTRTMREGKELLRKRYKEIIEWCEESLSELDNEENDDEEPIE